MKSPNAEATPWLERLASTPLSERARIVERLVVDEFKRALLMDENEPLPSDQSWFTLGLTSLAVTEVRQRLEKTIGRPVDSVVLFNHPTLLHLMNHLQRVVLADLFEQATGDAEGRAGALAAPSGECTGPAGADPLADVATRVLSELIG